MDSVATTTPRTSFADHPLELFLPPNTTGITTTLDCQFPGTTTECRRGETNERGRVEYDSASTAKDGSVEYYVGKRFGAGFGQRSAVNFTAATTIEGSGCSGTTGTIVGKGQVRNGESSIRSVVGCWAVSIAE